MPDHNLYYPEWGIRDPVFLAEVLLYCSHFASVQMVFRHSSLTLPGAAPMRIGDGKAVRCQFEQFQVLDLDVRQGLCEPFPSRGDEDEYPVEFGGHHQSSVSASLPHFLPCGLRFRGHRVQRHGPFHEPPDRQG